MPSLKQATQPRDVSNMTLVTSSRSTAVKFPSAPQSADPEFNPGVDPANALTPTSSKSRYW